MKEMTSAEVARDNTVSFANRAWQLERSKLRATLAAAELPSTWTRRSRFGRYTADGQPAMEMAPPRNATKPVASHRK